jgi:peptidyl-prolyl cis-trans isomerase D
MLRNFRQVFKGNQTPMAVVMMVVLLGMVAYLAPSQGAAEAPDNVIARVYGRDILRRDLEQATSNLAKRMGKQVNLEQMAGYLRAQAFNQLLQRKLAEELADRHGIVVTDIEVKNALEAKLRAVPAFVTPDNQLRSTEEINATLHEYGLSLKQWEEESRTELAERKLFQQAAAQVPVDSAWVDLENRVRNEKISFEAATLVPDAVTVPDPGNAKLETFLKDSGARFQSGPRRVVQYVVVEPGAFGAPANDEPAVRALYEAKRAQFTELKASHILFKASTETEVAEATRKAQELRAKLVAGGDFAKAATDLSEDPSAKSNHGDLGWFKSGQMVKPFEDAALTLKQGEISQPVRTIHGIHLIRLEGRKERGFDEVKEDLRAQVNKERFASKAKDRLEKLRKQAGERGDLAAPARNLGLKVQTSKPFADEASAVIEGLANSQSVTAEAFRLEVGQVSRTRQLSDRYVVFRVQEERPIAVPPLAEIRDKVLAAWKLEEARRIALDKGRAAVKAGNLAALGTPASQDGVTIASLAELGKHPAIRKALLETAVGQCTPALFSPDGKVWSGRIKGRVDAPALTFETRSALVDSIQNEVANKLLSAELRALDSEGRLHPGLSSFWGRFGGIWINKDAEKKMMEELPDMSPDQDIE